MVNIFNTFVYQPILDVLVFIYNNLAFHDLGFAIILLTILVRVVLFPIFHKSTRNQTQLQRLQPKIKKIQDEHKGNREAQATALLTLYKENKVNPFSGFLLLIVQLPIFIALFNVFSRGLTADLFDNLTFLGLINLGEASVVLALIAAGTQYLQTKIALGDTQKAGNEPTAKAQRTTGKFMLVFGPVLTVAILSGLPSALGLYWTVSNIFSLAQQTFINSQLEKQSSEKRDGPEKQ